MNLHIGTAGKGGASKNGKPSGTAVPVDREDHLNFVGQPI
jgi:hypothetical protein